MFKFGKTSTKHINTCHPLLQELMNKVLKTIDCSIIYGYRGKSLQNKLYAADRSLKLFPKSKHNSKPAMAVDVVPYINGKKCWDAEQLYYFQGYVKCLAQVMGIQIRQGADWDRDFNINDQTFNDIAHVELISDVCLSVKESAKSEDRYVLDLDRVKTPGEMLKMLSFIYQDMLTNQVSFDEKFVWKSGIYKLCKKIKKEKK